MELVDEFRVPLPPDEVFRTLLDLEKVATCMPGAELTGRDGNRYEGTLKLKVGPINASYGGQIVVDSTDENVRRAHFTATGSELHGQGLAKASVLATVDGDEGDDTTSMVTIKTDIDVQGKVAQFGRGILTDVSRRLISQFAANLEALMLEPQVAPGRERLEAVDASRAPDPAQTDAPADELDLLSILVIPRLRKIAPVALAAALALVLGWQLGRRGQRADELARLLVERQQ